MTIIIGKLTLDHSNAVMFYLDSLDICSCRECSVFLHIDDLVCPEDEDGFCRPCLEDEDGFICRPCLEKTYKHS